MSIFRAYDIRGIVDETLSDTIVYEIGRAIGSEALARKQQRIAVARDGRLSGPHLLAALIQGLRDSGRDVIDIGMQPTPLLYFATHHLRTGSGVMLTGSHNPKNYNGLKIVLAGKTLASEAIQALHTRIIEQDFSHGKGRLEQVDVSPYYFKRVLSDIKLQRTFKIVVDCGNGVAGVIAPRLLRELGNEVVEMFCDVDGNFPNHHPDPTRPENIRDLIAKVKATGADLGMGFDGDGDRLGIVDDKGNVIWADRQMILYAQDILSRHTGAEIIYDVKCSRHLGAEIAAAGGKPVMWKTGHSFMKSRLQQGGLLAGEMSGHIFFKERWYGFDDATYTAARLLEILSQHTVPPSSVFAQLPDAVNTPELQIPMPEDANFEFMQRFLQQATFAGAEICHIDGVRADFANGWGLVRASNTTPCLVLRFEGDDEAALHDIQNRFRAQLLAVQADLNLPF